MRRDEARPSPTDERPAAPGQTEEPSGVENGAENRTAGDDVTAGLDHGLLEHFGRRLLLPALLAVVALAGLVLWSDGQELARRLRGFPLARLLPVLALSLLNYGLRFGRWQLYLARAGTRLPLWPSLLVFLAGFALSVTPGKAGELGKAWLARELGGGPARRVVAVVIAERLTDLVGMLLLVGVGALFLPAGPWLAALCGALAAAGTALLTWQRGATWLLARARRLPGVGPRVAVLGDVYRHLRALLAAPLLAPALVLSFLAWGAEAIGFGVVARAYEPAAPWLAAVFNYSFSTLAGALSLLPGGLLASEGVLAGLLDLQGHDAAVAASATLIIRGATLWFAVALGLAALPPLMARLRRGNGGRAERQNLSAGA